MTDVKIAAVKLILFLLSPLLFSCTSTPEGDRAKKIPVIGFVDYIEDATLAQARQGFLDALKNAGYSEDSQTVSLLYRNAQGDQPTLVQAVDYIVAQKPVLIASNTTLATINAVQRNRDIPVFMMVAPRPDIAGLTGTDGKAPANLFGVYETLDYIDTAVTLITQLFPAVKKAGTLYSQSESQSVDALERLKAGCAKAGIQLEALPVASSSETQLITQALLAKEIGVFFALPDNVIFSSFETIVKACDAAGVPVLTSEAGLVNRGALASFGADMYHWGYQSGEQAAEFLRKGNSEGLSPVLVKTRKKVMNQRQASLFKVKADSSFTLLP